MNAISPKMSGTNLLRLRGPDQEILAETVQCTSGAGLEIMSSSKYLLFPTPHLLRAGNTSTFVHFSNTFRWYVIKAKDAERWMYDMLGLSRALDGYGNTVCAER